MPYSSGLKAIKNCKGTAGALIVTIYLPIKTSHKKTVTRRGFLLVIAKK
jgi:hypothetical protein